MKWVVMSCAALLSTTFAMAATEKTGTLFIGVNGATPSSDAAILVLDEPDVPRAGVKTIPMFLGTEQSTIGTSIKDVRFAVVKPGRYRITVGCAMSRWSSFIENFIDLDGGTKYSVRCVGRTPHTLKLVIEPIPDPRHP